MSEKFKRISDIQLVFILNEVKKAGYPEDDAFIKELQEELRQREKAILEEEPQDEP